MHAYVLAKPRFFAAIFVIILRTKINFVICCIEVNNSSNVVIVFSDVEYGWNMVMVEQEHFNGKNGHKFPNGRHVCAFQRRFQN